MNSINLIYSMNSMNSMNLINVMNSINSRNFINSINSNNSINSMNSINSNNSTNSMNSMNSRKKKEKNDVGESWKSLQYVGNEKNNIYTRSINISGKNRSQVGITTDSPSLSLFPSLSSSLAPPPPISPPLSVCRHEPCNTVPGNVRPLSLSIYVCRDHTRCCLQTAVILLCRCLLSLQYVVAAYCCSTLYS